MSRTEPDEGDRDAAPDGGSVFETMSETQLSREERLRGVVEAWILVPVRIIWTDWRARLGALIILMYALAGTVGVVLLSPPTSSSGPQLVGAFQTLDYPLGTDGLGQGLLRLMVHSVPPMFKMIFAGAVFATTVAGVVGLVSGYKGGRVDRIMMTLTDIMMTVPGLVLIIVIATIFNPQSPFLIGIVLVVNAWAGFARALRSQVLTVREESYVEASRALGLNTREVVGFDLVPNLAPLIAIYFVNTARGVIFKSVGLYYLGVLPYSTLNWGVVLQQGYSQGYALYTWSTAHWLIVPMVTIVMLTLGLILFAQGADRLFNPRIRARHADSATDPDVDEDIEGETVATLE